MIVEFKDIKSKNNLITSRGKKKTKTKITRKNENLINIKFLYINER